MRGGLRYEILGPMRLPHSDGQALRASKPRQLLATLLLHPNRFVSTDLIADALWEGRWARLEEGVYLWSDSAFISYPK